MDMYDWLSAPDNLKCEIHLLGANGSLDYFSNFVKFDQPNNIELISIPATYTLGKKIIIINSWNQTIQLFLFLIWVGNLNALKTGGELWWVMGSPCKCSLRSVWRAPAALVRGPTYIFIYSSATITTYVHNDIRMSLSRSVLDHNDWNGQNVIN